MNISFNLSSPEADRKFLTEARAAGFWGLDDHRSVGGVRASLYNAVTLPAVEKLADFMDDYRCRHP